MIDMRTTLLNITGIIIRLRLQFVGGSDKVCAYSSSLKILKAFLHFRLWSGGRLFTLSDASARIAI
jgi:hypothetical protein